MVWFINDFYDLVIAILKSYLLCFDPHTRNICSILFRYLILFPFSNMHSFVSKNLKRKTWVKKGKIFHRGERGAWCWFFFTLLKQHLCIFGEWIHFHALTHIPPPPSSLDRDSLVIRHLFLFTHCKKIAKNNTEEGKTFARFCDDRFDSQLLEGIFKNDVRALKKDEFLAGSSVAYILISFGNSMTSLLQIRLPSFRE